MGEIVKNWTDGGSLSVAYTGDGDGYAVITSSENTGGERDMEIRFVDASGSVIEVRKVVQAAMAEVVETYTRLTYIEATGGQYINTGYVVQEDDIIDMHYYLIESNEHLLKAYKMYSKIISNNLIGVNKNEN